INFTRLRNISKIVCVIS
ncbi:unnamed protein product, partial [Ilex paraguariensis]